MDESEDTSGIPLIRLAPRATFSPGGEKEEWVTVI
jgi:hypothetical protein